MKLREIVKLVLDTLNLPEGERRTTDIAKTAINEGYVNLCKVAGEMAYLKTTDALTRLVVLPADYLSMVSVEHNRVGTVPDTMYKVSSNTLLLSDGIIVYNDVETLPDGETLDYLEIYYMKKPVALVNDDDIPVINEEYHIGLCYYALSMLTTEGNYLEKFYQIKKEMPTDNFANESTFEEVVRDVLRG